MSASFNQNWSGGVEIDTTGDPVSITYSRVSGFYAGRGAGAVVSWDVPPGSVYLDTLSSTFYFKHGDAPEDWVFLLRTGTDITVDSVESAGLVTGTRHVATANGTVADPFIEGPNNTGIYVIDGTTSALAQGGGAWMTFGTGGIQILNQLLTVAHGFATGGVLSPAQITSNQTDYNPFAGNLHLTHNVRLSSDAARTINSLQPPSTAGQHLKLWNINTAANAITLLHDDGATGTAGARFRCPNNANFAIRAGGGCELWYDGTSSRWRVLAA